MIKIIITSVNLFLCFIIPVTTFFVYDNEYIELERRRTAHFPNLPDKFRYIYIKKFFLDFDVFFSDHFPLRNNLLKIPIAIYYSANDNLNIGNCYRGQENWLFLGKAFLDNTQLSDKTSLIYLNTLNRLINVFEDMNKKVENEGAEFVIFIGPDKATIYPEYQLNLPQILLEKENFLFDPLIESLIKKNIKVYNPTIRLLMEKHKGLLYYRTDTHWNALGAYEAFEGFRTIIDIPELPSHFFENGPVYYGDLIGLGGYTSFPVSVGDNYVFRWKNPPNIIVSNGQISNLDATTQKTAWIFGDSFTDALEPYIIASFKKISFFKHKDFNRIFSSQLSKPDLVIWITVARNFPPENLSFLNDTTH
jgi:hypothetical protein